MSTAAVPTPELPAPPVGGSPSVHTVIDVNALLESSVLPAAKRAATDVAAQATAALGDTITQTHQASIDLINTTHAASLDLIGQANAVADAAVTQITTDVLPRLAALEAAAIPALGRMGGALEANVETNKTTQHWLIVMIAGAALIGALGLWAAYLAGSHTAADTVYGAPALLAGALGLLFAHAKGLIPSPGDTAQSHDTNSVAGAPRR